MRRVAVVAMVVVAVVSVVVIARLLLPSLPAGQSSPSRSAPPTPAPNALDSQAIVANNRGVGLMGRYEFEQARQVFAELVEQHPHWSAARVNLALATMNQQHEGDEQAALAILDGVLAEDPDHLQAHYVSGVLRLYLDDAPQAAEHFRLVVERDPDDAHAAYFLARALFEQHKHAEALAQYEQALQRDPYLRSGYYGAFQALQRLGREDEAREMLATFERLADNPRAHLVDFIYTRMGPKGQAIAAGLEEPDDRPLPSGPIFADPAPLLTNGKSLAWTIGRDDRPVSITACDITGNGRLDIFIANVLALEHASVVYNAVCINQGDDTFAVDVDHPLTRISNVNAALWGDFDNDGLADVYLCRTGPNMLWRQVAENQWQDVTELTGTANGSFDSVDGLLFDADHDGDLDIFVVNVDGPNELLNNNRDGTFTPIAQEQGIAGSGGAPRQVIAVDLEGDRDLDIIVINAQHPHEMYLNDRLWAYQPAEQLRAFRQTEHLAVAVADANADGRVELFTATPDWMELNGDVSINGGQAESLDVQIRHPRVDRWIPQADGTWSGQSDAEIFGMWAIESNHMAMFIADLEGRGNGEPVLVAVNELQGLHVVRREGGVPPVVADFQPPANAEQIAAAMRQRGARAIKRPPAGAEMVVLNATEGPSVVAAMHDGPPMILRPGPGRHAFAAISFTGKEDAGHSMRSNASGIGTYYAARIGSRWIAGNTLPNHSGPGQSLQPVAIGLGGAERIDFLHIDWPDGVFQSELDLAAGSHHVIAEQQRQLSSCPVLWVWDGEQYAFVSDVLGVGGIGFAVGPGEYAPSRPWERFLMPAGVLRSRDGRYHLKLGEPMEEACYLDAARLVMYDLPPGWSMTLDERMHISGPEATGETRFYRHWMLPRHVTNERGRDVTAAVVHADLTAAEVPTLDDRFIGRLAADHVLTLQFDEPLDQHAGEPMLIAEGWVEYPYSQTMFAAWQAGATYRAPTVEARGADGQWVVVLEEFGYPAGMPRQMSVPLKHLPAGARELRITSNQEIYWDQLMVAWAEPEPAGVQRRELELVEARLWRSGFALREDRPQRLPHYDYGRRVPLWDTRHQAGWYTRFGSVLELVNQADSALAIFGPGEEVHMEFAAPDDEPAPGWTRHHVFETEGWCKDRDLFTRDGATLKPLPGAAGDAALKLQQRYNTRYESGR